MKLKRVIYTLNSSITYTIRATAVMAYIYRDTKQNKKKKRKYVFKDSKNKTKQKKMKLK